MGNVHRLRPASKRTHAQKAPKEDRVSQYEIDKRKKYIVNVRLTGIHWEHHVQRLERKYPNSMLSVYAELVDDVRKHRAKKAAKRAKLEERKNRNSSSRSKSSDEVSYNSSSDSEATSASRETFLSTDVTQAMLERSRGRPRASAKNVSRPSRQPTPRRDKSVSRQASQATLFSLSDDGSSAHDIGLATDPIFDDVTPMAYADFFAPSNESQPQKRKRAATHVSSDSESSKKRFKKSGSSQARVTEAHSEELAGVHSTKVKHSSSKDTRHQTSKNDSELLNSSTSSSTLRSLYSTNINSTGMRNDSVRPSQAIPSNSQTSIGSAFDELMYEDGTARAYIPLEGVSAPKITETPTSNFPTKQVPEAGVQKERMSESSSNKLEDKGEASSLSTKYATDHQSLLEPAPVPASSKTHSTTRHQPPANPAGPPYLSGSISERTNAVVDPEIASMIAKPNGLLTFLNGMISTPGFAPSQILLQPSRLNSQPATDGDNETPTISANIRPPVFPGPEDTHQALDTSEMRSAAGADTGEQAIQRNISSGLSFPSTGISVKSHRKTNPSCIPSNVHVSAGIPKNLPDFTSSAVPVTNPTVPVLLPAATPQPLPLRDAGVADNLNDSERQSQAPDLMRQDSKLPTAANCTIGSLKINPIFIKVLLDNAFVTISDLADANMTRDDIRLLAASIQEEQKISKSETVVAILRLNAALQRFQHDKNAGQ